MTAMSSSTPGSTGAAFVATVALSYPEWRGARARREVINTFLQLA
jgi:hypothetical protein